VEDEVSAPGVIIMKVNQEKCTGCNRCLPYCPVEAIKVNDVGIYPTAIIDQEDCLECGVCLKSEICPVDAIYWPDLTWPRALRRAFGAVRRENTKPFPVPFGEGKLKTYLMAESGGRGTSEMKTNDTSGRYREGYVGIAAEMGRPGVGFSFTDLEKVAMKLAKLGVHFEPDNPVTELLDPNTGVLKYDEVRDEKALSAIIEMLVKQENTLKIIDALMDVSKEIDSVFSIDVINKCKNGKIPIKPVLEKAGYNVRINGKTNIGLGRPLIE
jgi:ferredoxin